VNKEEKLQLRVTLLILVALFTVSILFLVSSYKNKLATDQELILGKMNAVASLVANAVDADAYAQVSERMSKGEPLDASDLKQQWRLHEQLRNLEMAHGMYGAVRLTTKSKTTSQVDRLCINLMADSVVDQRYIAVPEKLWLRYANVEVFSFPPEQGSTEIEVFAPVLDAKRRVLGHVAVHQSFKPYIEESRKQLMRYGLLYLIVLLSLLVLVFRQLRQMVSQHMVERSKAQEQKAHVTEHDPLTGLHNRNYIMEQIQSQLKVSKATGNAFAMMMLDLDDFKKINEIHGPKVGDELLKFVGRRLQNMLSRSDAIGRAGGDEFILLLRDIRNTQYSHTVAERIIKVIGTPFLVNEQEIEVTLSVGLCFFPEDGSDVGTLMRSAAAALNQAKQSGKNCYQAYDIQLSRRALDEVRMEKRLKDAIEGKAGDDERLALWYQPKVDMNEKVVGMEALVRWIRRDEGIVMPSRFIPIAEKTGLILQLGYFVLEEAARQLAEWNRQGFTEIRMSVNLSPEQFKDSKLVSTMRQILERHGVQKKDFEVEITESLMRGNMEKILKDLDEIHKMGITIAIDDFGTGYSNYTQLMQLPIQVLKVDKSFIDNLLSTIPEKRSDKMTTGIINFAKTIGREVVAEGVEERAQFDFLRETGCDVIQGYLFGKPLPAEDFRDRFLSGPLGKS